MTNLLASFLRGRRGFVNDRSQGKRVFLNGRDCGVRLVNIEIPRVNRTTFKGHSFVASVSNRWRWRVSHTKKYRWEFLSIRCTIFFVNKIIKFLCI